MFIHECIQKTVKQIKSKCIVATHMTQGMVKKLLNLKKFLNEYKKCFMDKFNSSIKNSFNFISP